MGMNDLVKTAIAGFRERCGALGSLVNVYDNPTEEIREAAKTGKQIRLFAAGQRMLSSGGGAKARLEENYLYDSRRFASGTVAAGSYLFFQNAIGLPAGNNGFAAAMVMSDVETNMDVASQIPQGKDYVLTSIGVSFNSGIIAGDLVQLMDLGALRFSKQGGQYTLKHGPVKQWPSGMGIGGFSTATSVNMLHNGVADIRATRKLAVPRILKAKDVFNYSYEVPRAVTNLDNSTAFSLTNYCVMTVWLWGGQQDTIPV